MKWSSFKSLFICFSLLLLFDVYASSSDGIFSGRISTLNGVSGLVKVKVDFSNIRYLNKKDRVTFWDHSVKLKKCTGFILGKTNEYLLIKIPNFKLCQKLAYIKEGAYLKFFSQDLVNNLKMGRELVAILKKKRLAILNKVRKNKREVDSYIDKVDALNGRYDALSLKLRREWKKELSQLEEDKVNALRIYKNSLSNLEDVEFKMERYKVEDENLKLDRWSLDTRLFYKK